MGIAVVADPPVSVHLILGCLPGRRCLCNASLPKIMLSYVVLTEACVSPCHALLPERAAPSQVPTLKGTSLTLYSTLGYSNKLFVTPPIFFNFYGIDSDLSPFSHFFIASLPQYFSNKPTSVPGVLVYSCASVKCLSGSLVKL